MGLEKDKKVSEVEKPVIRDDNFDLDFFGKGPLIKVVLVDTDEPIERPKEGSRPC